MSELNGSQAPQVAHDWHPMVEATRITDPTNENFGRAKIDTPLAEEVAMDAAANEDIIPTIFASRDEQLTYSIEDAARKKGEEELSQKKAKRNIILKGLDRIDATIDPYGAAVKDVNERNLIEADAEAAGISSRELDQAAKNKRNI